MGRSTRDYNSGASRHAARKERKTGSQRKPCGIAFPVLLGPAKCFICPGPGLLQMQEYQQTATMTLSRAGAGRPVWLRGSTHMVGAGGPHVVWRDLRTFSGQLAPHLAVPDARLSQALTAGANLGCATACWARMRPSRVVEFPGGAVECAAGAAFHSRGRQLSGEQRDVERMHPDLCAQDRSCPCCMPCLI